MSKLPTRVEILQVVRDHFELSMDAAIAALGDPPHPRGLRDDFAAAALPAVLDQKDVHDGRTHGNAAWIAYQIADTMLEERAK